MSSAAVVIGALRVKTALCNTKVISVGYKHYYMKKFESLQKALDPIPSNLFRVSETNVFSINSSIITIIIEVSLLFDFPQLINSPLNLFFYHPCQKLQTSVQNISY